ncbi:hypothetical protein BZA05DRAFT_460266 [Tricharina praecox]|uniref:uncharacterized protein n=1 Tax=Tricharina praecox TaxID=43433 RepID=UPI0022204409|nr:uncharacterized protein BZA05DRAFT_460266 [Tricharina praecox]KAI5857080.1 hypothetical protein BZA05DRAFT_460266 [Tricharina praecox]
MYLLCTFLFAILAALGAAQTQPKPCNVPLILYNGLGYDFTVNVQNSSFSFHKTPINFIQIQPTLYRSVIAGSASGTGAALTKLRMTNNRLYLQAYGGKSYVGITQFVPPAEVFRYLRFSSAGGEELSVVAHWTCDENGTQQIVVVPQSGGQTGLTFCVAQDRAGTYDLSVKPAFENQNPCIDVVLAIQQA